MDPKTPSNNMKARAATDAVMNTEIIRSLGRKARHRLDEERSKRREIQRFENHPEADGPTRTQRKDTLVVPPLKFQQKKKRKYAPRKRKAEASDAAEDGISSATPVAVNHKQICVDRWMPDVSHMSSCLNAATATATSSVIQLHGLPVGASSAHICLFFSGLDPFRILILVPLTTSLGLSSRQECIPELDADYNKPPRKKERVERHQNLRVLVKFDSAPTASLAVQRSGEILHLPLAKQGAALAVTPVSKSVATYLIKNLAVEADPGQALEQTVKQMVARLDPMVSPILWDAAIYELHFNVPPSTTSSAACPLQLRPKFWTRARNLQKLESIEQQQETIRQWNDYRTQLRRQVERLARPIQLLELDPALTLADPVVSLTLHAVEACNREMERVEQAVVVATRWKRLADSRMPTVAAASITRCNF